MKKGNLILTLLALGSCLLATPNSASAQAICGWCRNVTGGQYCWNQEVPPQQQRWCETVVYGGQTWCQLGETCGNPHEDVDVTLLTSASGTYLTGDAPVETWVDGLVVRALCGDRIVAHVKEPDALDRKSTPIRITL
ncbi:MAG: hypothetical protein RLN75_03625 [Longimicrobiales bacterium]